MKRNILIIISLISAITAFAQANVELSLDTMQILIGDQTKMTITATVKDGSRVVFPKYKERQILTRGIEVVEALNADTTKVENGMITVRKAYTITSFDENLYYIPSQKILINGKPVMTGNLALKVLTVPVDTLHADKFFPPKDVQNNPFEWKEWSGVFMCTILFVAFLLLALYIRKRLGDGKPAVNKIKVKKLIPAHKKAITGIERLKTEHTDISGNQKAYYTELTTIIRQYIAERFHFNAMEMTSREIISRLRQESEEAVNELIELFRVADLVKFAKHSAMMGENDTNLMNALSFINETKTDEKEKIIIVTPEEDDKSKRHWIVASRIMLIASIVLSVAALAYAIYRVYELI